MLKGTESSKKTFVTLCPIIIMDQNWWLIWKDFNSTVIHGTNDKIRTMVCIVCS